MAINNYKGLLGEDMYSPFMTPELNKANILVLTHISSSKDLLNIRDEILQPAVICLLRGRPKVFCLV
jgi:hypothetical protein